MWKNVRSTLFEGVIEIFPDLYINLLHVPSKMREFYCRKISAPLDRVKSSRNSRSEQLERTV